MGLHQSEPGEDGVDEVGLGGLLGALALGARVVGGWRGEGREGGGGDDVLRCPGLGLPQERHGPRGHSIVDSEGRVRQRALLGEEPGVEPVILPYLEAFLVEI